MALVDGTFNLPSWFGVFDYIAYKVDGYNVILLGQVSRPTLKSDAENAVKHIEGVEKVDNQIEVLPTSPMDDELRLKLYRAIYGYPPLEKYALGVQKPIRIIVKNGRVTLEGVIDSEADKNLVTIRANSVPGNEGFPSVQRPPLLDITPRRGKIAAPPHPACYKARFRPRRITDRLPMIRAQSRGEQH